ncbi:hypothetical protein [Rhizobium rhizogenes]|uniref:hypothetical protein n=1 Tax=Rhizobium rhizogenes TaxID=359 RepID=UPI00059FD7DC|nr:hypothetical protein [Rhizobium rhizogenes]NTG06482.1 hypothetical protein [Rhizobium rhizogenes]
MKVMILGALAIVGLWVVWWIIKLVATYTVPPEKSGLLFLKQELVRHGVDVTRFPDAALIEIVDNNIKGARALATVAKITKNAPHQKNWRATLVRLLQHDAVVIRDIMIEGLPKHQFDESGPILLKYGVIKES